MKVLFFTLLVLLSACEPQKKDTENLPWKISITDSGATRVMGMDIGEITLKGISIRLNHIANTLMFETSKGELNVESYFGRIMIGLLEGRIIADLDASDEFLDRERKSSTGREATPNNNWQYKLSIKAEKEIIKMRVWRMVYMPVTQYEEKQIKFFGEPEETIKVTETAVYRLYPKKGLAILWDSNGGEIFYYAAPKEFARLKASLPMESVAVPKKPVVKD
ncbi:MAG TPA: hypothetical protein EYG68_05355 [Leucothrix mucor]|nr:hypothetical protein [Leucothrix mucor]